MLIGHNLRTKLGKFYLDLAENLPPFKKGFIAEMQKLRALQRRGAQAAFSESRFPPGVKIELSRFQCAEIYFLEETAQLKKGLERLFPTIHNEINEVKTSDEIEEMATRLGGGGWHRIGIINRKSKFGLTVFGLSLGHFREIPSLPPEIEYIEVSIHKFLSSSIVIVFDVHLTDDVTNQLLALHNQIHLSNVILGNVTPWNFGKDGWKEMSPFSRASEIIQNWLAKIQVGVEKELKKYFSGLFFRDEIKLGPKLPTIEIYYLRGVPNKPDEFINWIRQNSKWWSSLGFGLPPYVFADEQRAYIWPQGAKSQLNRHRLIIHQTPQINTDQEGLRGIEILETLRGLLLGISMSALLNFVEMNVMGLRLKAYKKRWRLKSAILLNREILIEAMTLERIMIEFQQNAQWIRYIMLPASNLKSPNSQFNDNLQVMIVNQIEQWADSLNKHLMLIKKYNNDILANTNTAVMYRLAWGGLFIGIVGTFFTIVGTLIASIEIYKDWDIVLKWWELLKRLFDLYL